jgi:hypothetical protein
MKILDDEKVLNVFEDKTPRFSLCQIQIHIDYSCGCKIAQDDKGSWLFPCKNHRDMFEKMRDNKTIHKTM